MSGGVATVETGVVLPGPFGAQRLSWMNSTSNRPWFAVFFVDQVIHSYYWPGLPLGLLDPINIQGRQNWYDDVEEYEALAAQMTEPRYPGGPERDLWKQVNLMLVHVERASRPRGLLPIVPVTLDGSELPYPSHINAPDLITMTRSHQPTGWPGPSFDMLRFVLEHGGSPTWPRLFHFGMSIDVLRPGWTEWIDRSPVPVIIHEHLSTDTRWVQWAIAELERALRENP